MSKYLTKWRNAISKASIPEIPTIETISEKLEPYNILNRLNELENWRDNFADPKIKENINEIEQLIGALESTKIEFKDYVDSVISKNKSEFKDYVDSLVLSTKNEFKDYVDSVISESKSEFKDYIDTLISSIEVEFKEYVDSIVSSTIDDLKRYINNVRNSLKQYIDTVRIDLEQYVNRTKDELMEYVRALISRTKAELKAYTDSLISDIEAIANNALEQANIALLGAQQLIDKLKTTAENLGEYIWNVGVAGVIVKDTFLNETANIKNKLEEFKNVMDVRSADLWESLNNLRLEMLDSFDGINAGTSVAKAKLENALSYLKKLDVLNAGFQLVKCLEYMTWRDPDATHGGVLEELIEAFGDLHIKFKDFRNKITDFGYDLRNQINYSADVVSTAGTNMGKSLEGFSNSIVQFTLKLREDLEKI